jgi:FtsZ-interacting cell division protein ZipA
MKAFATHGITFTLDVPRVADGPRVFDRMIALAKQFAAGLGGTLVDDNRAPLGDSALDVIHDKIVEIEQRMAAQGLIAGGPQALRLFS